MAQDDGWIETEDALILKKQALVVGLGKVTSVAEDRAELEPGTAALRVRRADHSATLPLNPFAPEPPVTARADPGARFSKVPVTLRARNQIFKSKYKE